MSPSRWAGYGVHDSEGHPDSHNESGWMPGENYLGPSFASAGKSCKPFF